jgi:hypothetical protein
VRKQILPFISAVLAGFLFPSSAAAATTVLVEAEGFENRGGWVVDQQFMDQMGSPFLLAHGIGNPVEDATTTVAFAETGDYRVWVRTRDWVGSWKEPDTPSSMKAQGAPGKFALVVDGKVLRTIFGVEDDRWHWQDGGTVKIDEKRVGIALHDLTGFDGRCDAVLFSNDATLVPPNKDPEMAAFRRRVLGHPEEPPDAGTFDFVVTGGGVAGTCAAISAARQGLQVALIQDRPVLGGNNSSEVRVHLGGKINLPPYPAIGNVVDEIDPKHQGNAQPASFYDDEKKLQRVLAEKNIHLFLNMHVNEVEMNGSRIAAVVAQNTRTGERLRFPAQVFADCTGDGTVGFLAGADFRMGREARAETGEMLAPETADKMTMGASVMWYSVEDDAPSAFPDTPWAVQFNDRTCQKETRGNWDWETGMHRHQVDEFEYIRDHGLRVVYGNWSFLKNKSRWKREYSNHRLEWVAYIAGKRESRRLLGDVILKQQDIEQSRPFPDACVTTTWSIDLHYPKKDVRFDGEPFRSVAEQKEIKPYPIPFRCLYSRNIGNLMMAGRNISVTHVALGTVRVMRTTGMMGEVIGLASSLCKKHNTDPRGVYEDHLEEFKQLLERGVKDTRTYGGKTS